MLAVSSPPALKIVANPTNRAILSELAQSPSYPRELARRLGMSEDDVQRKLRRMEGAGLVRGEWAHVGRTVKLYRVLAQAVVLDFGTGAVRLEV